jgi:predicted component of type VI protein secretion system
VREGWRCELASARGNFSPMKVLVVKAGPLEGSTYAIESRVLIGRDGECDIQVIDQTVSRKHACVLEQNDGSVLVRDLGSDNGTWLRKQPVSEALLQLGDEIAIGDSRFEYREISGELPTREMSLNLISGPAQTSTLAGDLDPVDMAELKAVYEAAAQRQTARPGPTPLCCSNPLATIARAQQWKFCPACGAAVGAAAKD